MRRYVLCVFRKRYSPSFYRCDIRERRMTSPKFDDYLCSRLDSIDRIEPSTSFYSSKIVITDILLKY